MRLVRIFMLLALLPTVALAKGPSIYVCAHPDDCLLFMSPNLYDDIVAGAGKVVVVYLTSGDAGLPFNAEGHSYPVVRELATIDATEWMADIGKDPIRGDEQSESVTVDGHAVARVSYGNTVTYFLRLPDGNFDGNGFERYNHHSLRKLKSGETHDVTTVDGQANYADWQALLDTLSGIVARETEDAPTVTLHVSEPDTATNVHDHSDHTTGGTGVMEMLAAHGSDTPDRCYVIYKHIDYSIAERVANLEGRPLANKAGGFAVLTATQRHFLQAHNWDEGHLAYITRNYFSTETLPSGCDQPTQ